MKKDRNAFLAGLFMLLSIALIIATIIGIKGSARLTDPADVRTVRFALTDNIGGLRVGDDVRVGGLKVGVVKDVKFEPSDGKPAVIVWFTLPRRVELRQGAHVQIESTVTGTANLNIDSLGADEAIAVNETITGAPSTLSALLAAAGQIAPEVKGVVSDVRSQTVPRVNQTLDTYRGTGAHATELVKAFREKLNPIIERYNGVADAGKGALDKIKGFFGESSGGDFQQTMANLKSATGDVKEKLPGIIDKVDSALAKSQTTVEGINTALEDIKKVAANTRDITASGRSVVVGNRSKIETMIASLKTTGDNLKNASSEIRRSPWRLLYKPGPGEVANLNLYDSARQFAEGAAGLSDAASALRDALKDPNVDQQKVQQLVDQLDKSFGNFNQVETQLWKGVRE